MLRRRFLAAPRSPQRPTELLRESPLAGSGWLHAPFRMVLRESGARILPDLLTATLLITVLGLALPLVLLQTYDRILPNAAFGTLSLLALGVLGAILLEALLRMVRGHILGRVAAKAETEAQRAAIGRVLRAPSGAFDVHGNGYYSERLSAIGSLREAWSGTALQAMLDLPFALLYLAAIWFLAGRLILVPLGMLVGIAVIGAIAGRRVRRQAHRLARAEERRFNFLLDTLRGLQTIKLLGAERLFERRYERLQGNTAELRRGLSGATAAGQEAGLLSAQLATIAVTAWGCLMVLDGELTVGGLGACAMLTGRSMQPLLGGIALWSRYQALEDARLRVGELAAIPVEDRPDLPPLEVTEGRISLQDVRFGLLADGAWLFDGLNLEVAPHEIVGINGPNGSGRSSLLRLIVGEVAPASGRVLIDGQDLSRHDVMPARPRIALVPPDPVLVRGTLLQNLTLHQPELEDEALRLAMTLGLDQVASTLAEDWHTLVGPGAAPVARGVAQRIGLVRALVQQPRILLLDDVTAQLDAAGDLALVRLLEGLRGQCTTLLVSHRRSALAVADRVLDIDQGHLRPAP